jgi:transcription antitermination protein NusB
MQVLYTLTTLEGNVKPGEPQKLLQKHFDQSKDLLQYFLYFITEVASYAETDAHKRSHKHLPTKKDLQVNTKIAGNELVWKLKEDPSLKALWEKSKPWQHIDKDLVKKFYSLLSETEIYQQYISVPSRDKKTEKQILDHLFEELMLPNESFISHLEENYSKNPEQPISINLSVVIN